MTIDYIIIMTKLSYCFFLLFQFCLVHPIRDGYAPINDKPYPTQYGDGWGITKGFDPKFRPRVGHLI